MPGHFSGLRRDFGNWAMSGGYAAALVVGLELQSVPGWHGSLIFASLCAVWAWLANLKRYRLIIDTPTARIATAAQGYSEFTGRGITEPDIPVIHPQTELTCLWYRTHTDEYRNRRWYRVSSAESNVPLGLDDGSGTVWITPTEAEIVCSHKLVRRQGFRRETTWALTPGLPLYALGDYIAPGNHGRDAPRDARLAATLAELKADRPALLHRYDTDHDGEIDLAEWENARHDAARAIAAKHGPPRSVLRKPRDGRPFLLSDKPVTELAAHYRRWSFMHLAAFTLATLGQFWVG